MWVQPDDDVRVLQQDSHGKGHKGSGGGKGTGKGNIKGKGAGRGSSTEHRGAAAPPREPPVNIAAMAAAKARSRAPSRDGSPTTSAEAIRSNSPQSTRPADIKPCLSNIGSQAAALARARADSRDSRESPRSIQPPSSSAAATRAPGSDLLWKQAAEAAEHDDPLQHLEEYEHHHQDEYVLFTSTFHDGHGLRRQTERIQHIIERLGCELEIVDLYVHPELRSMMAEVSGDSHTLPQVFKNGACVVDPVESLQYVADCHLSPRSRRALGSQAM